MASAAPDYQRHAAPGVTIQALHVSQQYPSREYPALGVMVQNAVRAQAKLSGVRVEVLAPRPYTLPVPGFPFGQLARLPTQSQDHGYRVHRPHYVYLVPKRWLYPLVGPAFASSVRSYARQLVRPDVIHAHWAYPDGEGALALRDLFKVPLIVHARGTLERVIAQESRRSRLLVQTPLLAADAVIANSQALRDDCLGLGVPAHKLHVIPNGVDTELFTPHDKAQAKRELGLDAGRVLVLYCGNLRHVKGVDLLSDAIPEMMCLEPNLQFLFVGSGELEPQLRSSLSRWVASRDVIFAGAQRQREVARYMSAADLLVLPSRSEARSNVIPEALASGTPVAAAAVGGIPEVVRPEHGRLFSPESRASLAQAVLELCRDRPQLARMGEAGRRFMLESDASWGAHAEKTLELYRSLV
ncbi:MAG TPA: glycosyltransferase [Polyangiales bacterium]|nr:glycosyltransferase [Polyangiales bacterium]